MATQPHRFQSVRFTLLAFLVIGLILTLLVIGASSFQLIAAAERGLWRDRQQVVARSAGQTVGDFLRSTRQVLPALGAVDAARLAAQPELTRALLTSQPTLLELIRTDASGTVFAAAAREQALLSNLFTLSQATWYQQARAGQAYLSAVQLSSRDEPYLILAEAAPDGGVVAARLNLLVLSEVVAEVRGEAEGQAYILQQNGRLIVTSDDDAFDDVRSLAERPELPLLRQLAANGMSADYVNFEGETVFGTAAPVADTDLIVVTEVPQELTHQASQRALTLLVAGLLGFGIVTTGLASLLLGRLIFRPLGALQRGAVTIARGELDATLAVERQDELGQVAGAFNAMAEAVRSRERRLEEQAAALEQQVLERTVALRREIEERERLQAETIRQAEAMVALSTPVIPVSNKLLVLPVIGNVDQERLGQVQAALLTGIERHHHRAVIIDLTGVALIDAAGAAGLLEATRMAALLGVSTLFTGISPEVAQTLVTLGSRLEHLRTFSTLQEAIAATLRHETPRS